MQYHNQCISPGNVLYGTTTSAFHLAICYAVPRPVPFTWQCVIRYHNQCNMTMRHTVPRTVQHDNAPYGNTTSVFHMAICHTVTRPVSFTWQSGNGQFVIQVSTFNLHRNNLVEMSTVSTYNILSYKLPFKKNNFNVVFQKLYPEKITELSQVTEKVHLIRTWSRTFNLCAM
jgi:hypothetical protein